MPRDIAVTCQACLAVNDPADVLSVKLEHGPFPKPEPLRLCRLCTLAIMKAAIASELIDPSEVFGVEPAPPPTEHATGDAPGDGAEGSPLAPPSAPDAESGERNNSEILEPANGEMAGPMPGGKCALDCGRLALDDDIYCGECRSSLRE